MPTAEETEGIDGIGDEARKGEGAQKQEARENGTPENAVPCVRMMWRNISPVLSFLPVCPVYFLVQPPMGTIYGITTLVVLELDRRENAHNEGLVFVLCLIEGDAFFFVAVCFLTRKWHSGWPVQMVWPRQRQALFDNGEGGKPQLTASRDGARDTTGMQGKAS